MADFPTPPLIEATALGNPWKLTPQRLEGENCMILYNFNLFD